MTKKGSKVTSNSDAFEKLLKKSCKNCSENTVKVYVAATKRLHRLVGDGQVPATGSWLNKKALMTKYKKLPLTKRRALSVAAVKAAQAYSQKFEKWSEAMYADQEAYMKERGKNERSDAEIKAWPKHGFAAIKKAAKEQRKRITHTLREEPSLKNMYPYMIYILFRLYSEIPFRNTFADLNISDKSKNYVEVPRKGAITLHMKHYKNVKQLGEKEIKLSRGATTQLRKFLKYREGLVDHDWLFSGKTGKKLSRQALGKLLHRATRLLLGRAFGSRLIRVLAATEARADIEKVSELSKKMLHTTAQTKQYTRKIS